LIGDNTTLADTAAHPVAYAFQVASVNHTLNRADTERVAIA
jgi:hypothetical protein